MYSPLYHTLGLHQAHETITGVDADLGFMINTLQFSVRLARAFGYLTTFSPGVLLTISLSAAMYRLFAIFGLWERREGWCRQYHHQS